MIKCSVCNIEIPEERADLGYTTCIKHSTASKKIGFMVYNHKTAPEIAIVDPANKEGLRQATRAFNRDR